MAELTWLLTELELNISLLVEVFSDSKSALQIAANPVFHERTNHIEIDWHFIREKVQQGKVKTQYIPTKHQPANIFTKVLYKVQHYYLTSKLGILNICSVPNLRGS